jgi:hypothetical protein
MKSEVNINGRLYDTRTGALIRKESIATKSSLDKQRLSRQHQGFSIDGVSRRGPKIKKDTGLFLNNSKPKTLARNAVKKPTLGTNSDEVNTDAKRSLFNKIPESRATRASVVKKNCAVSRFDIGKQPKIKVTTSLPVVKEPRSVISELIAAPPLVAKLFKGSKVHQNNQEVFEHKIHKATNHLNPPVKKEKYSFKIAAKRLKLNPKFVSITAIVFAFLLIGGYLTYIKVPTFAMKVAASRAGFEGRIPSNVPAGYSFKAPIISSKGNIALNYASNSDSRKFEIVQKPTNWSSESLIINYLIKNNTQYQTYNDGGLTVFIYNRGNATWVDKGIWYTLTGQNSLSSEQILAIASSM